MTYCATPRGAGANRAQPDATRLVVAVRVPQSGTPVVPSLAVAAQALGHNRALRGSNGWNRTWRVIGTLV